MARRILLTLCLVALGGAAWWIMHRGDGPDEGLVVVVTVVDEQGAPLPGAQVQAVFSPGWRPVDKEGSRRLTRVLLRAEEEPSALALRAAIQVRARFYTHRRGSDPEIAQQPDGSWTMRFALQHHGVFRLAVADTHLGDVKAFLEPDEHWEAMDRGNVARPGSPAAYRIYPGMQRLIVRLVGEPDKNGVVKAATRRYVFRVPAPGYLIEETVTASQVQPILGTIEAPAEGPTPPSLMGTVTITGIASDGSRLEYGTQEVDHSGAFIIRTLGDGEYELQASCPYLDTIPPAKVTGGDVVTLRAEQVGWWLVASHPDIPNSRDVGARFTFLADDAIQAPAGSFLYAEGQTTLPLVRAEHYSFGGTWALAVSVPGTSDAPPRYRALSIIVSERGPQPLDLKLEPAEAGTIVVRVARAALEATGGASVRVGAREETTLIAKLAEEARFPNVAAGEIEVVVEWNRRREPTRRTVTVKPNETTTVEFDGDA